jgi:hypothetical protein
MSEWKYSAPGAQTVYRDGPDGYESVLFSELPGGTQVLPADDAPELTAYERDIVRYTTRASIKDRLIAEMAAENMARVRAGTWTVPDLVALTQDEQIAAVLSDIGTLSYELAAVKLAEVTNPLITEDIKAGWIQKLQDHFYL